MQRGILFDLDGTLLDTAPDFFLCLNQLLADEGHETLPLAQIREVVSAGAAGLIKLGFGLNPGEPDYTRLKDTFLDRYEAILGQKSTFFPGIESLLEKLQSKGIPWGIVTNKPERFTFPLLEKIGLTHSQCVICADTLEFAKPHPMPIEHACELLNILPQRSMYVGDDLRDVQSSRAAGMPNCVVQYGYIHKEDNPKDWQASYYVEGADEIYPLFEKMV